VLQSNNKKLSRLFGTITLSLRLRPPQVNPPGQQRDEVSEGPCILKTNKHNNHGDSEGNKDGDGHGDGDGRSNGNAKDPVNSSQETA